MDESNLYSDQKGRLPARESIALADLVLRGEGRKLPVNIIFSDDSRLQDLNFRFRGIQRPTDVLSFPADADLGILGDIYLSIDAARRQAGEYHLTLREEILRLVCHGTLHLCGYDHSRKGNAEEMRKLEEKYLGRYFKDA